MKKIIKLGFILLAAGLLFVACGDDDGGSSNDTYSLYTGTVSSRNISVELIKSTAVSSTEASAMTRRITLASNDYYRVFWSDDGDTISAGRVTVTGNNVVFTPLDGWGGADKVFNGVFRDGGRQLAMTSVRPMEGSDIGAFVATFRFGDRRTGVRVPQGSGGGAKTVAVGPQTGNAIIAGTGGDATYTVTTANIANAAYPVTVANLPTGVTIGNSGQVTINNNAGTLTLTVATTAAIAVIDNLTLTIDGVTSAAFTLTIADPAAKTVSVGTQVGTLTAGTADTVTFPVTTTNIEDDDYTVTVQNRPTGVTVQGQVTIDTDGKGTLTLAGNASTTPAVTNDLTLTIAGATSPAFTLEIVAAGTKTVSVGSQSGTVIAGATGNLTFSVTTSNIAANTYPVTPANLPSGVTVSGGNIVIAADGTGTLTLAVAGAAEGSTSTVTIAIDGATSGQFTVTIAAAALVDAAKPTPGTLAISPDTYDVSSDSGAVTLTLSGAELPAGVSGGSTSVLKIEFFRNTTNTTSGGTSLAAPGATTTFTISESDLKGGTYGDDGPFYFYAEVTNDATGNSAVTGNKTAYDSTPTATLTISGN